MSTAETAGTRSVPLARAFPKPGPGLTQAFRELDIAMDGTPEQVKALGDLRALPRPWDPPSITQPQLRREVWAWLEAAVTWLNLEYTWDVGAFIPECWPKHPHIVHEVAVIADLRRRAGTALTSDALEEWHRYALPAFTERMRSRIKTGCDTGHQEWPARSRFHRHVSDTAQSTRSAAYLADEHTVQPRPSPSATARLRVVDEPTPPNIDPQTGEVLD
ncbi:MAG: hypothetical protein L0G89_00230 [Janibacter sp.]|nr:hypothetical protein [Janibacter sp.]